MNRKANKKILINEKDRLMLLVYPDSLTASSLRLHIAVLKLRREIHKQLTRYRLTKWMTSI